MKKVVLNLAVSLDGFIASDDGTVKWLDNLETDGSDLGFTDFLDTCDTLIIGRKSYDDTLILGNGIWPFPQFQTYVYTRNTFENKDNITFVNNNPVEHVKSLIKEKGKNIWLFGGGSFIKTLREQNLIDEYIITIIPKMIGKGIKLFQEIEGYHELEVLYSKRTKNIIQTHYKVRK